MLMMSIWRVIDDLVNELNRIRADRKKVLVDYEKRIKDQQEKPWPTDCIEYTRRAKEGQRIMDELGQQNASEKVVSDALDHARRLADGEDGTEPEQMLRWAANQMTSAPPDDAFLVTAHQTVLKIVMSGIT